jgi:hypothetical protein
MKILLTLLFVAACLVAPRAYSQTVDATARLTITAPTKHTDGSSIPTTGPLAIAKYQVWLSRTATRPAQPTAEVTPATAAVSVPFTAAIGDVVSAWVAACSGVGECSAVTNPVTYTAQAPKPGEPIILDFRITFDAPQ